MNLMLLLAQVAPALADSVAGANPVLTPIAAPDEMNLWSMAVKGGWIMVVLGVLSVVCFYILFERNYVIRKAGKEDPMFMDKIKDYILGGEIKAAIAYCRSVDTPSARMIEKGISRLGRPVNDVQAAIENVGNIEGANPAFRRYIRGHDYYSRRSDCGHHRHVRLQLPGDAGGRCGK